MKKIIFLGMLIINTLCISAQDNNTKWRPEITCTEVCGVRFGSSYETAKEKYPFCHWGIDDNGFKYYESGCSPLGGFGNGFIVDVVKFDEPYNGYRYFARIMYGPYNYVKEEF